MSCDRSTLPASFEQFPRGSCGDTAPLLGHYLTSLGLGEFDYVLGERGRYGPETTEQSHAWLQQGMAIVDITADQFEEIEDEVIVLEDSDWHRGWRTKIPHRADHTIFGGHARRVLDAAYTEIVARLSV